MAFRTPDNNLFYLDEFWPYDSTICQKDRGNGMAMNVFDASRAVPTGPENTVLNVGRTPVIYLGV
ncbi:hypothetical protein J3U22_03270 [Gilliamella sp. B2865]|uniref:hypothetical protein n=1 Tax=Gilliamella sp. B2865 TaxID=2817984 RepID=UPI002269C13A|nr:hypothetical protein [Gilliamella sp. B2865]MCX8678617.1 hypothetical protein [Gilliamella sp. B2865]